jgi:hypothetical protein
VCYHEFLKRRVQTIVLEWKLESRWETENTGFDTTILFSRKRKFDFTNSINLLSRLPPSIVLISLNPWEDSPAIDVKQ